VPRVRFTGGGGGGKKKTGFAGGKRVGRAGWGLRGRLDFLTRSTRGGGLSVLVCLEKKGAKGGEQGGDGMISLGACLFVLTGGQGPFEGRRLKGEPEKKKIIGE